MPNFVFEEYLPKFKKRETKVLLAVIRLTIGWNKVEDKISASQISKLTGIFPVDVSKSLKLLNDWNVIELKSEPRKTPIIKFNLTASKIPVDENYKQNTCRATSKTLVDKAKSTSKLLDTKDKYKRQNIKTNRGKPKKEVHKLFHPVKDLYFKLHEERAEKFNQPFKAVWTGREGKELNSMLARDFDLPTIELAMRIYMFSEDPWTMKQGGSATYFFMNIHKYLNGEGIDNSQLKQMRRRQEMLRAMEG